MEIGVIPAVGRLRKHIPNIYGTVYVENQGLSIGIVRENMKLRDRF